jgi:hypothetical protein
MKHTLTTTYQVAEEEYIPVDITFRHYSRSDALEFIWAAIPENQYPLTPRLRIIIERWASNWLQEHKAEALAIVKGE